MRKLAYTKQTMQLTFMISSDVEKVSRVGRIYPSYVLKKHKRLTKPSIGLILLF